MAMNKSIGFELVYYRDGKVVIVSHRYPQALSVKDFLDSVSIQYAGKVGVWGKPVDDAYLIQDQDRVELYQPLLLDPKELRRQGRLIKDK